MKGWARNHLKKGKKGTAFKAVLAAAADHQRCFLLSLPSSPRNTPYTTKIVVRLFNLTACMINRCVLLNTLSSAALLDLGRSSPGF